MTDYSKWNAEDRRLVSTIAETEQKLAQVREDRDQDSHLTFAYNCWIQKYEEQLTTMRAQLEQVKSLYA